MTPSWQAEAEQAAVLWRQAEFPIALTGAGISVASGIPDFRSPGGLWTRHDPAEVATIDALRNRPAKVWDFLYDTVILLERAQPNPAHTALAELEAGGRLKAVITQNIDSLHQRAGSRKVVEFHGSGRRFYCMGCREEYDPAEVTHLTRDDLPWTCGMCQRVIRPDFVFFGERIPQEPMGESMRLMELADFCLVAGTSGEVAPANTLPYRIKAAGGRVVEINLGPSAFGELPDVRFDAPAEEVLPGLGQAGSTIPFLSAHGPRTYPLGAHLLPSQAARCSLIRARAYAAAFLCLDLAARSRNLFDSLTVRPRMVRLVSASITSSLQK